MAKTNTKKKYTLLGALVLSLLSVGVIALAFTLVSHNGSGLALVTYAKDGEDNSGSGDNDEDDYEDEEDDARKDAEKAEKERIKKLKEAAKEKYRLEREKLKSESEARRQAEKQKLEKMKAEKLGRGGNGSGDDQLKEEAKKAEEEAKEVSKLAEKKADIIEDIYEEILEAEEEIVKAQVEGADVTQALATLATAKARAEEAKASLATADVEALKRLAREVKKLAHFASHKDVKAVARVTKDVQKISKRIAQTEGKIALLSTLGGDVSSFQASLEKVKSDFAATKDLISKGGEDQVTGISQLEPLERRVKTLKSSIENAIYALGGTDDELDSDYENEVKDIVEELNDVAEIEGDELEQELKSIALAQEDSVKTVGDSVERIDNRNRVLQFIFGARKSDIERLEAVIAANKIRVEALNQAASKIEDADVKQILLDQVAAIEKETQKLETFVSGQKDRLSLFGWLLNLNPGQQS